MTIARKNSLKLTSLAAAVLALSACGGGDGSENKNTKPAYLGAVVSASYDGASDDLLTAGLGKTGLGAFRYTQLRQNFPQEKFEGKRWAGPALNLRR